MNGRQSIPERRWRWVSALVLMLMVGIALGMWIAGGSPTPDSPEAGSGSEHSQPLVNGVPVGYERSEAGAVEAATNFARVMADFSLDNEAYRRAIGTLAAPEWRTEAEDLADSGLRFFSERYGTEGSLEFVPVRYRVSQYSDSAATVELWGVSVASGPKIPGIEESWVTGIIELTWSEGDWRVAGQRSEVGPTPELMHAEDDRARDVLVEFEEYSRAPAP